MEDYLKPCEANSSPLTPLEFLERAAIVYGNCPSVVYKDRVLYTWSQTHERCLRLASALSSLGISTGDVVSVVAPNVPAMYEMQFGVPMSGAILNPINTRLDASAVSVILRHSEAKLVFVDFEHRSLVQEAVDALDHDHMKKPILVVIEDDEDEHIALEPAGAGTGGVSSPAPTTTRHLTYRCLLERGHPNFRWVRPETEWAPMVLNYTSGTTSAPKGVLLSHRALFIQSMDSLLTWSVPARPVYLWTLPMFHANGWSYTWGMAAVGGTNVCLRKFDAGVIYEAIARHGVTHMCGAPVVLNMLANAAAAPDHPIRTPLPHVVRVMTAGAPPPAAVLFRTEALGFSVSHGYGLTETAGPVVSCAWKGDEWDGLPAPERARLKARQGVRNLCIADVDVIDPETGAGVERDGRTRGEIVLRGRSVMLGYLKDPESTRRAMRNGWLYTGDIGVMHPDGYVEIKDRCKDIIITGGENVSTVEVESVLYQHPSVHEAAVVARPDEFWGESPCAFLKLIEEALHNEKGTTTTTRMSHEDIIAFCRERLPHYTVPKSVVFVSELPKTSTGKIQKFVLRDIARNLDSSSTSSLIGDNRVSTRLKLQLPTQTSTAAQLKLIKKRPPQSYGLRTGFPIHIARPGLTVSFAF